MNGKTPSALLINVPERHVGNGYFETFARHIVRSILSTIPSHFNHEHTLPVHMARRSSRNSLSWRRDWQLWRDPAFLTYSGAELTSIILGIAARMVPLKPSDVLLLRQIRQVLHNLEMEVVSPVATRQIILVSTFLRIATALLPSIDIQRNNFYNSSVLNTRSTTYQMVCRACSSADGNQIRQMGHQAHRGQEEMIAARIMRWVRTYVGNETAQVFH